MKVSVSITTYNHERFIAQAIESVLMQQTDFDYEVIIGEDDSSDGTREIVQAYGEKYPDRIRLFLNDRQDVIYFDGRPTGKWNLINNLKHARGEYVALLDGDDYWTSPDKLQTQVLFLDSHPECAICFHAMTKYYEDDGQISGNQIRQSPKEISTLDDLLEGNFIAKSSVLFRNGLFGEFPDWYYRAAMGDWPLHILNAQYGNIGYIVREMAVHRIHIGGMWSSSSAVRVLKASICLLEVLGEHLDPKYGDRLSESITRRHLLLIWAFARARDYGEAVQHIVELLFRDRVSEKSLAKALVYTLRRGAETVRRRAEREREVKYAE